MSGDDPLLAAWAQTLLRQQEAAAIFDPQRQVLCRFGDLEELSRRYETEISCACGAVYHTRSTRRDIKIGICAACHPFFTGEQKFVDTAGRVEKFTRRYGSTKAVRAQKKA